MISGGRECLVRRGNAAQYTSHSLLNESTIRINQRGKEITLVDTNRDGTVDIYIDPRDLVMAKPALRPCNGLFSEMRDKLIEKYFDIVQDIPGNNWNYSVRHLIENEDGYFYVMQLERIESDGNLRVIKVQGSKEKNGFVKYFHITEGGSSFPGPNYIVNIGDDYSAFGRETADKFFEEAKNLKALSADSLRNRNSYQGTSPLFN